jgi:hypothetical protein
MKSRLTIPLVLALLLVSTPASARQLRAADPPRVRGPLRLSVKKCAKSVETAGSGVIARARSCVRLYNFSPSRESDGRRNYGVVWLHTSLDTRGGWCATRAWSEINVPTNKRVHARAPSRRRVAHRTRHTTRLVVDAAGTASSSAVVKKGFLLYPLGLRGALRNRGRVWRTTWRGSSHQPLGFASGIEISWHEDFPPAAISGRLRYRLEKRGPRC